MKLEAIFSVREMTGETNERCEKLPMCVPVCAGHSKSAVDLEARLIYCKLNMLVRLKNERQMVELILSQGVGMQVQLCELGKGITVTVGCERSSPLV